MPGKGKNYTFGIMIDWITSWGESHYYQSLLLSGLSDFAKENNINVLCFVTGRINSPYEWDRCRNILLKFIDKNKVDGLVVPTTAIGAYSDSNSMVKLLASYDLPIVTVGERFEDFPSVTIDNYTGMRQVVDHLIEEHGYRRIAFIKGPPNKEAFIRFQAYCDSLAAHQIDFDPSLIYNGDFRFDSGSEAVRTFRRENIQFDALVCSNDNMAMGALLEFNRHNKNLVFTLPITGFDDTENGRVYGLTTVRQNFYEQTRKAGEMLLNILEGKDIACHVEIPSRMILRSSCGCVPSVVKKAYVIPDLVKKDTRSTEEQIDQIMSVLEEINDTLDISDSPVVQKGLKNQERQILESFFDEFHNGDKDKFVMSIHRFILWCSENMIDWLFIQDLLPAIRKTIMNSLETREDIIRAENLLHAATIFLFDTLQNSAANRTISNPLSGENTERLGEALMASLDYENQLRTVCQLLPLLDIHTCYIALFEDEENPLDKSRLILAMTDRNCYKKGGQGIVFNTRDLLPEPFLEELYKDRFSLVVQALHQGNNKMGYVILDFDTTINKNYEIIRYRLSVSLKGTMLIERITKQAANLEIQVKERTRELSESNMQLKEEIARRKEAERRLKKALRELSYYNEQLHLQSIRDELTQVYNRRGFMKLGNEYFEIARKNKSGFLLLYADLDGLKKINDQFGHSEGDYAIVSAAKILGKVFRHTDIIGRMGGDEFTVIISDASKKDEDDIRNRIQRYCDLHNELSKKPYKLSISIGFAYYDPESSDSFQDLMRKADKAQYEDKQKKLKKAVNN